MTTERIDGALRAALAAGQEAGAQHIEVSYVGSETDFTRFARSRFTQVGTALTHALRIRVIKDGRLGSQMTASLDAAHVRNAARGAVVAASSSPRLDVAIEFAGDEPDDAAGGDVDPSPRRDRGPLAIPQAVSALGAPAALRAAFGRHADIDFAGSVKARRSTWAVRTSAGASRWFEAAEVDTQLIAIAGDASAHVGSLCAARDAESIDLDTMSDIAADKALCGRDPIPLDPGVYDVVLAPAALAELIEWMSMASFGAAAVIDGTSLLAGRRGQMLCDPRITIADRCGPNDPPFDAEGVTRRPVVMVAAGAAGDPVTDLHTAAALGTESSTGHAPPITDDFARGPATLHIQMDPGDRTEADLIAAVDRGVYVTRFHYVNGLLDTRRATTTGMTRDGAFLIENGRLGRGVKNMRFTVHVLEALSRLEGLTTKRHTVPAWWNDTGAVTVPGVLLREFPFTG